MKDPKQLYRKLSRDFDTERYYSFANRGESMILAREDDGKRIWLLNTEREEARELVGVTGLLSQWHVGAVEISAVFDLPAQVRHIALCVQVPYYFGVEEFENGVAMVKWTLRPDGRFFADSDGFGMDDDEEVNLFAYIDREAHIIVPFQPMDADLQVRYRPQAERIAANRELPYVCLNPELTIPFEEIGNLSAHRDKLSKIIYGMMLQMSAEAANKDDDPEYDGRFGVLTAINPDVERHLEFSFYAMEKEDTPEVFELLCLAVIRVEGQVPLFVRADIGELTAEEISRNMENKEELKSMCDGFIEMTEILLSSDQQD